MKALFLIFHGFEEFNGISKKIRYQISALKECNLDVRTCYLVDDGNKKYRMVDNIILKDYGFGWKAKILKRVEYFSIINYVIKNDIKFIYVRYVHNSNPFTIYLLNKLKKTGAKIVLEIPTYPYDHEYKGLPFCYQRILFIDKIFRKKLMSKVDKIITFSDHKTIWGRPTINISNGIDFSQVKLKQNSDKSYNTIIMIGVATMHPWHGFDRIIEGMHIYYKKKTNIKVYFHIVGHGVSEALDVYKEKTRKYKLEKYVIFHGALYGKDLDDIFEISDVGIGSLARHRSNINKIKTLKNREYAARGIPFIYSEIDEDFEHQPYILKCSPDDTPIDIEKIISFYHNLNLSPLEIRNSIINNLSWKKQMNIVLNETLK